MYRTGGTYTIRSIATPRPTTRARGLAQAPADAGAREGGSAVWDGREMIVVGGGQARGVGVQPRDQHVAVAAPDALPADRRGGRVDR